MSDDRPSSEPPIDSAAPTAQAGGDVGSLGSLLRDVASTGATDTIAIGTLIGDQFRVVRTLGRGGMGVVYEATDERLHRTVALKFGARQSKTALARMQREAAALAQLAHPNVVVVHQVGEHDGRVFLAMEHVTGGTARDWLRAKPRPWRAIVALFAAAGDGLQAAHQAGLIHRDFKPDNVLVGDDDRPRVADFGLVRAILVADDDEPAGDDADLTATRAGSIVGTPAYMPLEQLRGEAVDARADQFAFCASLWEALHGARPFAGDTPDQMRASIEASAPAPGEVRQRVRGVPRHITAALRRGLRPAPADRWPTMDVLLRQLRRDPGAVRRRATWLGATALVAVAIAVPIARRGSAPPCGDGASVIAAAWNPTRAQALTTALGSRAGAPVVAALDRYARGWITGHQQACHATRVARSQTDEMMGRRMQCLFAARAQLDATVSILETGTPAMRANASDAVGNLPDVDACADVDALADQAPLPTDPAARARIDEAERLFAIARAAELDDARPDPIGKAEAALTAARASGWKPLIAQALLTHAEVLSDRSRVAEATAELREACAIAATDGKSDLAAVAFADLSRMLVNEHNGAGADIALLTARAFDDRAGPGDELPVVGAAAEVAAWSQRFDEAATLRQQMIERIEREADPGFDAMVAYFNLSSVHTMAGRFDDALAANDRAIAWGTEHLGADHPAVGKYRAHRALLLLNRGRLVDAVPEAEAAIAILSAWYGASDVRLAEVHHTLADILMRQGDPAAALPHLERGLACARGGEDLDVVAAIQAQRAIYFIRTGDLDQAATAAAEVVDAIAARRGPVTTTIIDPLMIKGYIAREQGRLADSERDFRRGLDVCAQLNLADHPSALNLTVELGKTLVKAGRAADARALLAPQAAALAPRTDLDPILTVESHTVLAEALAALADRPGRAAALAIADRVAQAHPDRPDLRELVTAARAAHR